MNRLMKPERLSLDPNSPTVSKEWRHWRRTFENYLASFPAEEGEGGNAEVADTKLKCLINSADFNVFDYIEDCQSYETAINVLNALFIKAPCTVFSRHVCALYQGSVYSVFKACISYHQTASWPDIARFSSNLTCT